MLCSVKVYAYTLDAIRQRDANFRFSLTNNFDPIVYIFQIFNKWGSPHKFLQRFYNYNNAFAEQLTLPGNSPPYKGRTIRKVMGGEAKIKIEQGKQKKKIRAETSQ
jgi:hypothetical protein